MMNPEFFHTTSEAITLPTSSADDTLAIVVLDRQGHMYRPLPDEGTITIGREPESSVLIDRPWISRRHAVLHLGAQVAIEDVGAKNGIRVGGKLLAPFERRVVKPGEPIVLGATTVLLEPRSTGRGAVPAVTRAAFIEALELECARADKLGLSVDIVAIEAPDAEWEVRALLAGTHSLNLLAVQPTGPFLAAAVRRRQVSGRKSNPALAQRLTELVATKAPRAAVGASSFPEDGRSPRELVEEAARRAQVPEEIRTGALSDDVTALERRRVVEALRVCANNQSAAARMLGIARNTLIARMKAFGLDSGRTTRRPPRPTQPPPADA